MRKLKLQMQLSLDGFVAGPNGEMDWMVFNWDDKLKDYVIRLSESFDTVVLGRKLAEGFIPYWTSVAEDASNPEQDAGKLFRDTPKIVFTKTLDSSPWDNTSLAKGDISDEIQSLKSKTGKDIIAYGGANFVSSLIKNDLIDEYHLFFNPAAIGSGLTIFSDLSDRKELNLVHATQFDCGITVIQYEPKR